ncbi:MULTISPECIES: DUF1841 family protein [unclassified Anaeromyxobacter]|uniref:DUF1841 family protein n=1 Tax=unclassified Anaeromyxobacter TaxID=2620896 RepID=UPI001F56F0CF|nr:MULTISPECIES: DUF1841 family protein [unclassified Anaeromyxobacter]
MDYDADRAPEPRAWKDVPQEERLRAVEAHHHALSRPHPPMPKPRVHAALHLVVEDQLASGEPPQARGAVERLVAGGLTRHEALHVVGRVAADALDAALKGGRFDAAAYARALDALQPPAPAR